MREQILNRVQLSLAPNAAWLIARFIDHARPILIVHLIDHFNLIGPASARHRSFHVFANVRDGRHPVEIEADYGKVISLLIFLKTFYDSIVVI